MNIFLYAIIFCMGTVFGSFFTLAVYRIPLKKDITHERSFCPNCNHKLTFIDMIPVLSYIFIGGKCRYCGQKIRPRYLLLEILSGIVFVLLAMSIKLDIYTINLSQLVYLVFGLLYLATLFIIAGIDKEKVQIEKSVVLFGYIVEALYIIYLYLVENNTDVNRYVIYLAIICLLTILNIINLRKNAKQSYTLEILLLSMLMVLFTYELVFGYTVILTLITIAATLLIKKFKTRKQFNKENTKLPIGFYMCVSNIISLLVTNFYIFYL